MKYLLGIDVGTTGTKTVLFDDNGGVIKRASRVYPLYNPHVGWSEQNADDWWNAVVDTVHEVLSESNIASDVTAISVSTQGGTVVPVDNNGVPLRNAFVWNDKRFTAEAEEFLNEVGSDEYMYKKSGWHLSSSMPAMAIRWMRKNEPEIFKNASKFLSVPDFISLRLTGIAAADLSNLGINQLCDIRCEDYDEAILDFDGIDRSKLPKIVHSGDIIGHLTDNAAEILGLSKNTLFIAGAHDQYAVALGAGAKNNGDILIGSGTCWVVTSVFDTPDFESGLSQSVAAVAGKWGSLFSLSSGGVCLDWLRDKVITALRDGKLSYETINNETEKHAAAEEGLYFFPFKGIYGHRKYFSRASFVGLDLSHDPFNLTRAIMEGVVFQIVWITEYFKAKPSQEGLILSGGASKSPIWSQLLADISGIPVRIPEIADLSCVGAAILAGAGSGLFCNVDEGCNRLKISERTIMPDKTRTLIYRPLLEKYKSIAEKISEINKI